MDNHGEDGSEGKLKRQGAVGFSCELYLVTWGRLDLVTNITVPFRFKGDCWILILVHWTVGQTVSSIDLRLVLLRWLVDH